MTTPSQIRADLAVITGEAQSDLRTVAGRAGRDPATARAAMFAATPLIVNEYAEGAAALALDWYEVVREAAAPLSPFVPTPLVLVDDEQIAQTVAVSTEALYEIERGLRQDFDEAFAEALAELEAQVQLEVANGFRDTITGNAVDDPDAVGWQRYARTGACKFCLMLSARGAVYTEETVRFAAHTNCNCVAGPSYDADAPKADVLQYIASQRTRTAKERADLRRYLNKNFPDAPG